MTVEDTTAAFTLGSIVMFTLSCPQCGFSKEVPAERIPPHMKAATCPKCRHHFPLKPATLRPTTTDTTETTDTTDTVIVPKPEEPETPVAQDRRKRVTITCPNCGEQKEMPGDRLPARKVTLRCQACAHVFDFEGRRRIDGPAPYEPGNAPPPLKTTEHPVLNGLQHKSLQENVFRRRQLSGSGQLLDKAWQALQRRMTSLLSLNLIAVTGAALAYLILASGTSLIPELMGEGAAAAWLVGILHVLFAAVLSSWVLAVNTLAVSDDELGILALLLLGLQRLRGFFAVVLLAGLMISGGLALFVLPGLVFAAWALLAPFVLLHDSRPGMESLLKGRAYARQRPAVYARVFLPGLAAGLLFATFIIAPLAGLLLLIPLAPLTFTYLHALYVELEECGDTLAFSCSFATKARWLGVGAAGYLLVLLLGFGAFGPAPVRVLAEVRQFLPFQADQTSHLELNQNVYAPGEILNVTFSVPKHFPWDAWMGVIPAEVPHGDEDVNQKHALSYQHLEGRTRGMFHFRVPTRPGTYDVRIHNQDHNGRETASVSFRVVAPQ